LNGVCFFLTTARQHDKIKIENITQGKMINPKIYFDTAFLTQHNPYFVLVIYTNTLHRYQQHKIYKLEIIECVSELVIINDFALAYNNAVEK